MDFDAWFIFTTAGSMTIIIMDGPHPGSSLVPCAWFLALTGLFVQQTVLLGIEQAAKDFQARDQLPGGMLAVCQ